MEYTKHSFSNGLTLLCDHMPQIETVSIRILVKTGSRNESDSIEGISHIIEHMCFKGTENRSAKEIAEEFDLLGGHLNAYTSKERTVYYGKVLKNDLEKGLDILTDMMINSKYDPNELEREKTVIMQEISDSEDNPEEVLFEALFKQSFKDHQIGRPIAGTHETVKSCTRNDIVDYLQKHYNPSNTIIGVSGNFDESGLRKIIETQLGSWTDSEVAKQNENKKPLYSAGDIRIHKPIEQNHIMISFKASSVMDEDYYLQQITSSIAGGSMSSRLYQEVREKRGLAYSISSFTTSYSDCGIWGVYASTDPNSANELINVTIDELNRMKTDITEKELQTAKAQLKSGMLMAMESSSNRAEKLVNNFSAFGRIIPISEIVEKIDRITVEDVQECISNIFRAENCVFGVIGKIDAVQSYDEIISRING